jgi:hypothetical protein
MKWLFKNQDCHDWNNNALFLDQLWNPHVLEMLERTILVTPHVSDYGDMIQSFAHQYLRITSLAALCVVDARRSKANRHLSDPTLMHKIMKRNRRDIIVGISSFFTDLKYDTFTVPRLGQFSTNSPCVDRAKTDKKVRGWLQRLPLFHREARLRQERDVLLRELEPLRAKELQLRDRQRTRRMLVNMFCSVSASSRSRGVLKYRRKAYSRPAG